MLETCTYERFVNVVSSQQTETLSLILFKMQNNQSSDFLDFQFQFIHRQTGILKNE